MGFQLYRLICVIEKEDSTDRIIRNCRIIAKVNGERLYLGLDIDKNIYQIYSEESYARYDESHRNNSLGTISVYRTQDLSDPLAFKRSIIRKHIAEARNRFNPQNILVRLSDIFPIIR